MGPLSSRAMTTDTDRRAQARGVLKAVEDGHIVLQLPHTDYTLRLELPEGAAAPPAVGKRIRGVIEAQALRIHAAAGGGRFIEPIVGAPRIVSGTVLVVDEPGRRVLVDVAVPMWLHTDEAQDFTVFEPGGLVNGYVKSGATFTPADA